MAVGVACLSAVPDPLLTFLLSRGVLTLLAQALSGLEANYTLAEIRGHGIL